jgi:hypothetical protein
MLKRLFFVLITIAAAGAVMAQAYKWVDEDGIVHYSDRPQAGAERVQLPSDTRRPRPVPAARAPVSQESAEEPEATGPFRYETLMVSAPVAEETLWGLEDGFLNVSLDLRPALQNGHRIRVYFDGEPRYVTSTSFQIEEVFRGAHNIQAEVVSRNGRLLIRSLPSRFFVQQMSILRPRPP